MDQNVNHLRISMGGKKWYWSIVTWCLNVSVHNAWIIHRKAGGDLTYLEFTREVTNVLLRENPGRKGSGDRNFGGNISRAGDKELRFDNIGHYLVVKTGERRRCAFEGCQAKCQTYCEKCDRCVCTHHFKSYHTEQ